MEDEQSARVTVHTQTRILRVANRRDFKAFLAHLWAGDAVGAVKCDLSCKDRQVFISQPCGHSV